MRIASTQYHTTMNTALQTASARLQNMLQKMASGERYSLPSENPIANVRLSRLTREEAALDQYLDNIATLQSTMARNEALLTGMSADMLSARDLLVWASDGSNTSEDIIAVASSLKPLMDSLFYNTNTLDAEGRYVFSGTASDRPTVSYDPLAPVGTRYTATGNSVQQLVAVGNGITQPANVSLPEMADVLNVLERIYATLQTPGVSANDPAVRAELTAALGGLDDAINFNSGKIAMLGGSQNILETLQANHSNVSLSNKQAALVIGQLDYGDAAVKLNGYTAAIQATQKAYSQVAKLSLFDAI
ncbi:MAG: flagellar hook-associated protein 3 [Xanthomonadaceae bacterium]|nr:flagellar hook-associated protein 3 [Xanthomonadaceae bacterium]